MRSLPKPLIGLLVGTVAFFALWMVALKPSSPASSGGVGQYQPAINGAHGAVTTSGQANAKLGAPTAPTAAPASPAKTAATVAPVTKAASAAKIKATTTSAPAPAAKPHNGSATKAAPASTAAQVSTVVSALRAHKVVAVLFYNPAAADDQSMKRELAAAPKAGVSLVKVAVSVSQLTQFAVITGKVPVVTSPTLVIVDPKGQATTITGWASAGEVATRIGDAQSVN
jgi:hypothetical protein